jgi:hypothetical protein
MASVPPPNPAYTPSLPESFVSSGKISDAQLEFVVYVGQVSELVESDSLKNQGLAKDSNGRQVKLAKL